MRVMTRKIPLILAGLSAACFVGLASLAQERGAGAAKQSIAEEQFVSTRDLIERYETDRRALERFYGWRVLSQEHFERMEVFNKEWAKNLKAVEFETLPLE